MTALSNHAENLLLDWLMTDESVTRPTSWYLALFTAAPNDSGGGTEVSGSGYSRQAVAFTAASSGAVTNDDLVSFTADGGNWGSITHAAIFDAGTSGNMLWHGALSSARTINDTDTLNFAAGEIDLSLD